MTEVTLCDACGDKIDLSLPYFQITALKLRVEGIDDPTVVNTPITVEVPQQFHYHDGHQPDVAPEVSPPPFVPPEPEPTFTLDSLNPTGLTQRAGAGKITVHALGTGFVQGANIVLNNVEMATTFVSDTDLTCQVAEAPTSYAKGTYDMLVRQEGKDSDPLPFTIS
jgi:IPT/TIG domain